jgi:hypothetical protein
MTRRGFTPVYDRGQLLVDLAVTQLLGGEAISDFQGLRHLAPVIGPIPSNPTVWRALAEVGGLQLARITAAVTTFRRHRWGLLAARPDGFPWLRVAGRELTEITVVDLDASIVSLSRFPCKPRVTNTVNLSQGEPSWEEDDQRVQRCFPAVGSSSRFPSSLAGDVAQPEVE